MTLSTDRIVIAPAILTGKPIVRGTRLSVEFLIGLMAQGWSEAESHRAGSTGHLQIQPVE